ncbi:MAG: hypothetical protein LKM31_11070 [Sphingobium sp.]|nr:hypothetical protein [Sphingobium sp.]
MGWSTTERSSKSTHERRHELDSTRSFARLPVALPMTKQPDEVGFDVIGQHGRGLHTGDDRFGIAGRIAARQRVDPGQQPRFHETRWQIDRPIGFF